MDELVAYHRVHRGSPIADPCANIDIAAMGRLLPSRPSGGLYGADQLPQHIPAPPKPVDLRVKILEKKRAAKRQLEEAENARQPPTGKRRSERVRSIPRQCPEDHPPVPAKRLHNLRSSSKLGKRVLAIG